MGTGGGAVSRLGNPFAGRGRSAELLKIAHSVPPTSFLGRAQCPGVRQRIINLPRIKSGRNWVWMKLFKREAERAFRDFRRSSPPPLPLYRKRRRRNEVTSFRALEDCASGRVIARRSRLHRNWRLFSLIRRALWGRNGGFVCIWGGDFFRDNWWSLELGYLSNV